MSTIERCDAMNVYFFLFLSLCVLIVSHQNMSHYFCCFSLSSCPCGVHDSDADEKMCGWEYYIKNILKSSI